MNHLRRADVLAVKQGGATEILDDQPSSNIEPKRYQGIHLRQSGVFSKEQLHLLEIEPKKLFELDTNEIKVLLT